MNNNAAKMNNQKGFSLLELMTVISTIALLASLAIPGTLRNRLITNETVALANAQTIATAIEIYGVDHEGTYPTTESQLTDAVPAYLNQAFNSVVMGGYSYSLTLSSNGYTVTLTPVQPGLTGDNVFTASTGGFLAKEPYGDGPGGDIGGGDGGGLFKKDPSVPP